MAAASMLLKKSPGFSSIKVNKPYGIIHTIRIRTDAIVLLTQQVYPVSTCGDRVVLSCAIVVGVKAVHPVQFLAVVLVRLHVGIHHGGRVGVWRA